MTVGALLFDGPKDAGTVVILAHGAGAAMDTPFMTAFAQGLGENGLHVVRFEFPYMAQRRETGKKRPPDRAPKLLESFSQTIDAVREISSPEKIIIAGKSMGGRMASMLAAELEDEGNPVDGLVALGYPFHAPGKDAGSRIDHLLHLKTPTLILQGERDPFGKPDEVSAYPLSKAIRIDWLPDGDHGFKPRKASGLTETGNWTEAIGAFTAFVKGL